MVGGFLVKYTIVKDGKYTGVTYEELNEQILAHHASQNELVIPVENPPVPIAEKDGISIYGEISLEDLKSGKILELNSIFQNKLKEGFQTSSGIVLSTTAEDYQFYTICKERAKSKLNKAKPDTVVVTVRDKDGNILNNIPAIDYINMIEELEEYLESLWYHKAELEDKIKKATSVDELKAIEW